MIGVDGERTSFVVIIIITTWVTIFSLGSYLATLVGRENGRLRLIMLCTNYIIICYTTKWPLFTRPPLPSFLMRNRGREKTFFEKKKSKKKKWKMILSFGFLLKRVNNAYQIHETIITLFVRSCVVQFLGWTQRKTIIFQHNFRGRNENEKSRNGIIVNWMWTDLKINKVVRPACSVCMSFGSTRRANENFFAVNTNCNLYTIFGRFSYGIDCLESIEWRAIETGSTSEFYKSIAFTCLVRSV